MEHRRVCRPKGRDTPVLPFCSPGDKCAPHVTLHQEQKGLPGYALKKTDQMQHRELVPHSFK